MIDQGSGAEVIYPNLYKGLGLTPKDLTRYDTPLVAFDGTVVTLAKKIRQAINVGGRKELVDFIVVHSYSLYTVILGHPWIHSMRVLPSSLHQKVKFPTDQGIFELRGDQNVVRRCQIAAIGRKQAREVEPANPL